MAAMTEGPRLGWILARFDGGPYEFDRMRFVPMPPLPTLDVPAGDGSTLRYYLRTVAPGPVAEEFVAVHGSPREDLPDPGLPDWLRQ